MGRLRMIIYFALGAATSLLGRNDLDLFSKKDASKEVRKKTAMSLEEYLATLPIGSRCRARVAFYELVVRYREPDSDRVISARRELAKCPAKSNGSSI